MLPNSVATASAQAQAQAQALAFARRVARSRATAVKSSPSPSPSASLKARARRRALRIHPLACFAYTKVRRRLIFPSPTKTPEPASLFAPPPAPPLPPSPLYDPRADERAGRLPPLRSLPDAERTIRDATDAVHRASDRREEATANIECAVAAIAWERADAHITTTTAIVTNTITAYSAAVLEERAAAAELQEHVDVAQARLAAARPFLPDRECCAPFCSAAGTGAVGASCPHGLCERHRRLPYHDHDANAEARCIVCRRPWDRREDLPRVDPNTRIDTATDILRCAGHRFVPARSRAAFNRLVRRLDPAQNTRAPPTDEDDARAAAGFIRGDVHIIELDLIDDDDYDPAVDGDMDDAAAWIDPRQRQRARRERR